MIKITEYQLATATSAPGLVKAVQELIAAGFEPHAAPVVLPQGAVNFHFQAMVKRAAEGTPDA